MQPLQFLPMRAVVRCKAKQKMLAESDVTSFCMSIDESLLKELTNTLFCSDNYLNQYQHCRSQAEADAIADQMATELSLTYQQIKQQQNDSVIQKLNTLFNNE